MSKYSVKRPFTVLVAVIMILVLGGVSYFKMTTDLLPNMNLPYVLVITSYPGASPEKVEKDISGVLESALGTVNGVENVTSVSNENYSIVTLEFQDDMNMDSAMVKLSTAVNEVKLPELAGKPSLMEISPDMMATMYVSVDYDGKDIYELTEFCKDTVIPYFERQAGVASVDATGLVDKKVEIRLNQGKINIVNAKVMGLATDKLEEAQKKLDDAKKELDDAKSELNKQKDTLASKQADATGELAEYSKLLDEAMATKAAYQAQVMGLEASKKALESEKEAYDQNKVKSNYDSINKMISSVKSAVTGEDAYQTVYAQVYSAVYDQVYANVYPEVLTAAVSQAVAQAGLPVEVTKENAESVLAMMGDAAVTIKSGAEAAAKQTAEGMIASMDDSGDANSPKAITTKQLESQAASLPVDMQDAIKHPKKLEALKTMLEQQGQKEAAKNLTKDNLKQLYDIVNTRIPQIDTELANLDIEIMAAKMVLEEVEKSIKEAEDNYIQVEEGKMTAAASFGAYQAQMASGENGIKDGEKKLEESQKTLDDSRDQALKSANMDALINKETLAQILSAENFSMPAGYVDGEGKEETFLVKVGDEYDSIETLENTLLTHVDDIGDIRLSDVADFEVTDNAGDSYAKMNENQAVILSISKASTAGTSEVSKTCNEALAELMSQYPGMHLTPIMDQGDYIKMIIHSVMSNLIWGALLAILVLILFLKDVRPTIVVAFSIPLSVLFAIVLMFFSKISMNIISLSGLALGVGMLVDNSIVVIENIYRYRNQGMEAPKAAVKGANQVAGAIFASTLTTICVFLPIVFATGLVRQIFTDMGLTIAFSLMASLIVALTLVPAMSATVLKNTREKEQKLFQKVLNIYEKILRFCLKVKIVPLFIATALLAFCIWETTRIGLIFMPEMGGNQMSVTFTAPDELSETEGYELADEAIHFMASVPGVKTVGAMAGGGSTSILSTGSNKDFQFFVLLNEDAAQDNQIIAKEFEKYFKGLEYEDLKYSISTSNMDMSALLGSGLEINIYGNDTDQLLALSEQVMDTVAQVEGFEEITNGQEEGKDEIRLEVDKSRAMRYNLTVAQIFQKLSDELATDKSVMTIEVEDEDYEIVIIDETAALSEKTLMDYEFEYETKDKDDKTVTEKHKMREFVKRREGKSLATIRRENQSRYITVSAKAKEGYNTTLLARKVEEKLKGFRLPENYTMEIAGESESVTKAMKDLGLMIALAVTFIYLIMVAQFQSLLSPFIVLFTIPLAFTGGFLALFLTGTELSVVAMMGFLVLAGVVVNNGIVFVDYANQLRISGMERRDALVKTGRTRMRPILMTALTTILAMSTMALSKDPASTMGKGMAMVTIGGLGYATLMTLFIVPVLYDAMFKKELHEIDVDYEADDKKKAMLMEEMELDDETSGESFVETEDDLEEKTEFDPVEEIENLTENAADDYE